MTTGGWITMILSVGCAVGFFIVCVTRVLLGHNEGEPPENEADMDDEDLDTDEDDVNGYENGR